MIYHKHTLPKRSNLRIAFCSICKVFMPESNITLFLEVQRVLHLVGPHLERKLENEAKKVNQNTVRNKVIQYNHRLQSCQELAIKTNYKVGILRKEPLWLLLHHLYIQVFQQSHVWQLDLFSGMLLQVVKEELLRHCLVSPSVDEKESYMIKNKHVKSL